MFIYIGKSYIWMWKDIPENGEDFGFDLNGSFFWKEWIKEQEILEMNF